MAQKIVWTHELIAKFEKAGFTPAIIKELTTLGEVWRFGSLYIVIRGEGKELVWMATLGTGIHSHVKEILLTAKRAGATTMRFHVADDEKAIVRFWRRFRPVEIKGEGFDTGAYRVDLGAVI
ncbi:hypothetical protein [Vibrio panuliri]|uniref:Uncharacterized protein n=1 Tax=Vibrio panuliri TaxID=1381081 RepID=A0ABX3FF40_9VIBR|nr:hypothetical protein [Vibrio panuliri]KAB1457403.1 hypothetical protein F7O85_06580 [Vibrio panuliri]OLQ91436.1 hypothetical protein BIY20_01100 [Vibrio panuliri]